MLGDFMSRKISLFFVFVLSCLLLPLSLTFMEENLSVFLSLVLVVVLISQAYDGVVEATKSQILVLIAKFKRLYLRVYLNLYLCQVVTFFSPQVVCLLSGYIRNFAKLAAFCLPTIVSLQAGSAFGLGRTLAWLSVVGLPARLFSFPALLGGRLPHLFRPNGCRLTYLFLISR